MSNCVLIWALLRRLFYCVVIMFSAWTPLFVPAVLWQHCSCELYCPGGLQSPRWLRCESVAFGVAPTARKMASASCRPTVALGTSYFWPERPLAHVLWLFVLIAAVRSSLQLMKYFIFLYAEKQKILTIILILLPYIGLLINIGFWISSLKFGSLTSWFTLFPLTNEVLGSQSSWDWNANYLPRLEP